MTRVPGWKPQVDDAVLITPLDRQPALVTRVGTMDGQRLVEVEILPEGTDDGPRIELTADGRPGRVYPDHEVEPA